MHPQKEVYEIDTDNPQAWAEETVERFNATLRPGEKERILLDVEVLDEHSIKNHSWEKQNLVTVAKLEPYYDVLRCKRCGITAKRFGLDGFVLDPEFREAKVYRRCDTALAHLKKRKEIILND